MWSCVFPGMASAPPFPISFLLSPRSTAHFTYFLPSLQQLEGKRSNFKTCPFSHFSIKCSSPTQGSTADDSFFQENKELNENSAEMSAKLAKLGLAAVLAYGLFDGVTYTSFFVLAFLGYEKSTGNNPAANLQALLGIIIAMWAGNNVTRPFRVAGAAALAPAIDKGLRRIQKYFNFPSLVYAFALVVGIVAGTCFTTIGLLILSRWGK
ncbi:PREDICTED: uncharacterized protein LOC109226877 isoform X2 [Nicotiana attenuata]|uniref:uncharacterized protein LOC109226877 isoform X2 n=1 Tax=Nicotiana attenuata TaxID=49451 RepID=UPI000904A5BA|nr:PREDICTED: uncharacterized protein LOC109226877 isoform X2 [Nicotiana attenuata]